MTAFIFRKEVPGYARIIQDLSAGCFRIDWSDKTGSLHQIERIKHRNRSKAFANCE
jgi:hypothetical protein